jgi:hypothetical protein
MQSISAGIFACQTGNIAKNQAQLACLCFCKENFLKNAAWQKTAR